MGIEKPLRISCKCTTYGRVNTLEELLYSFLHLEYDGWKELVIVNDYPLQKLHFDHPEVRIYNLDETFPIIGEKENYTIEKCEGDIIAVFDDDDIAFPNHLDNINKCWKDNTNLIHWNRALFYNGPNASKITGVGNSGIVFSKKVWEEVGKSPIMNAGGDMDFVVRIHNLGREKVINASPEEVGWIYRWGIPVKNNESGVYHQSGQGTDTSDRPNIVQRHMQYIESQRKKGKIPTGDIELQPHWNYPYDQILKNCTKDAR